MYLHLGGDIAVPTRDIVAVLDLDNASYAWRTREFLRRAELEGSVVSVSQELPKSLVVCRRPDGHGQILYLCQPGSATLLRRSQAGFSL